MNEIETTALFALALVNYETWGQYLIECHTEKEILETGHTAKEVIESLTAHHEYAMEIASTAF
tara:strand:+ start:269 stop:457 length:189 start_codon:yes stop_codon:yes gene_type:complete